MHCASRGLGHLSGAMYARASSLRIPVNGSVCGKERQCVGPPSVQCARISQGLLDVLDTGGGSSNREFGAVTRSTRTGFSTTSAILFGLFVRRSTSSTGIPSSRSAAQTPKGRRLGSDPPAAPAAASGIQIKHGRLETGQPRQPRSEPSSVLEGAAKRARVLSVAPGSKTVDSHDETGTKTGPKNVLPGTNAEFRSCGSEKPLPMWPGLG